MHDTEKGLSADKRLGKMVQPPSKHLELTGKIGEPAMPLHQASSSFEFRYSQCVSDCFVDQFLVFVPGAGPAVQLSNQRRLLLLQPTAQHLSKQVMVAIPLPLVIEEG